MIPPSSSEWEKEQHSSSHGRTKFKPGTGGGGMRSGRAEKVGNLLCLWLVATLGCPIENLVSIGKSSSKHSFT